MKPGKSHQPNPPEWMDKLLQRLCAPHLLEEVMGDLHERFHCRAQRLGPDKARQAYLRDVLSFIRPHIIKRKSRTPNVNQAMVKNYLKVAFRTLWKNKKLSGINIFGLATGIACSLLIFMYVTDELSYDRHVPEAGQIHRVVKDFINDDGSRIPDATSTGPLAGAMQQEIPQVLSVARIHPDWGTTTHFEYDGNKISEGKVWRVDSSFFDVFSIRFLNGDPENALSGLNSIVLTERMAKKYFGDDEAIGKTLRMNDEEDMTVTAVIEDVPAQSHFHYDFLLSYRRLPDAAFTNWGSYNYYTYVKVAPGTDMAQFDKKIQEVYERHTPEVISEYYTQPLRSIHLSSQLKWELEPNGDRQYVNIFILVGIFIILIAGINYINLSTAKSAHRGRETGIRKVVGAGRKSLILQYLLESVILSIISALVGLVLAQLLLPLVNELTGKQLTITPDAILYMAAVALFIGILAGIVPAMYLASFKPLGVLKGLQRMDRGSFTLRKTLVIVQFTMSIALIVSALIIVRQVDFLQSKKLGFDKEQVLIINNARGLSDADRNAFLNELKDNPGVEGVALSSTVLGKGFGTTRSYVRGSDQQQQLNFSVVGFDFLDVVGMEVIEGRGFTEDFPSDTIFSGIPGGPLDQRIGGIVLNEQAVEDFSLDAPVGSQLIWGTDGDTTYYVEVVGIVKDFHFSSLRNEIKPYGFILVNGNHGNFTLKIRAERVTDTMQDLAELWGARFPEVPFEYQFLDETFAGMYTEEVRFEKVFLSMVVLGIIIACLGLFALSVYSAEQRFKEIGIRKVLGATAVNVVMLLSGDFLKPVVIAMGIAIPIALLSMQHWLEGFAYRTSVEWWLIVLAGVLALLIAFLTISVHAIKAALADPVDSIRGE